MVLDGDVRNETVAEVRVVIRDHTSTSLRGSVASTVYDVEGRPSRHVSAAYGGKRRRVAYDAESGVEDAEAIDTGCRLTSVTAAVVEASAGRRLRCPRSRSNGETKGLPSR